MIHEIGQDDWKRVFYRSYSTKNRISMAVNDKNVVVARASLVPPAAVLKDGVG